MGAPVMARRWGRGLAAVVAVCFAVSACSGDADEPDRSKGTPTLPATSGRCGDVIIAYSPANGYEASAFMVGALAEEQLGCTVTYRKTSGRKAWRLVASGDADVYLDAYGSPDLRHRFVRQNHSLTVVGPNGIRGGVDLLAPYFMAQQGLESVRDLDDTERIGWGVVTPVITTVPELEPLAHALIEHTGIDYAVRDFSKLSGGGGMGKLLQQPSADDTTHTPDLYLVEAPRAFLGNGAGQASVDIPESAEEQCVPDSATTLCSLRNFRYLKIANAEFAASGSPAYRLIYQYQLSPAEAANILEIVELSGYAVGPADVASWINTHRSVWQHWLD